METIFYTKIETAPTIADTHAGGASSGSLAEIVRHAHRMGYELVPFDGWTDAHVGTGVIQQNESRIEDLLNTLEIQRSRDAEGYWEYYPKIYSEKPTRLMDDDEGLAVVAMFTK